MQKKMRIHSPVSFFFFRFVLFLQQSLCVTHITEDKTKLMCVFSCSDVRENTIASMRDALLHGADMVEFDVQVN